MASPRGGAAQKIKSLASVKSKAMKTKAALVALKAFFVSLMEPTSLTIYTAIIVIGSLLFVGIALGQMFSPGKVPTQALTCSDSVNPGGDAGDSVVRVNTAYPPADLKGTTTKGDNGETTWSAEQAGVAWSIWNVGQQLGASDHLIMVAIAMAMQEYTLQHKEGGDRDSQGLYQQRPTSGWGKVEYIMNITYAITTFYKGPVYAAKATLTGVDPAKGEEGHENKYKLDIKKETTIDGTTYKPGQFIQWGGSDGALAVADGESKTVWEIQAAMGHNRGASKEEYNRWTSHAEQMLAHVSGKAGSANPCSTGLGGPNDAACWYPDGLTKTMLDVCGRVYDKFYTHGTPPMTKDGPNYGGNCKSQRDSGDHPHGRACDFMMSKIGTYAKGDDKARGDAVAAWAIENYKELGVCWMSWQGRQWSSLQAKDGWRPYSGSGATAGHYDHVHISTQPDANKAAGTEFMDCG